MLICLLNLIVAGVLAGAEPQAWFTDVTPGSGIPALKYAEGVNFRDLDGDGLPELFLPNVKGRDRLFKNLGGCRFKEITDESGIKEKDGIGAVFADFTGDGRDDLYVVRGAYPYGVNVLYEQTPEGKFRDITGQAGVASGRNGISANAADLDGDGRLDLLVSNWGRNILYKNMGGGKLKFSDATESAGLNGEGRSWGAVVSDFNGDGRPDIFVVRGGSGRDEGCKLYINQGGKFKDETASAGLDGIGWSMGAVACDFDCDGSQDLFVCGYDGPDRIFLNDGRGRFRDVTAASGITSGHSVGSAAGDIDGDLLPDIVVAGYTGGLRLYKNLGGGRFTEVKGSGFAGFKKNEGVALADIDGDGDLDIYVANYDGNNRLYKNNLTCGAFLKVLPGGAKGRPVAGTAVRLYREGGLGQPDMLLAYQELQGVYGFCSQSPAELLFRLPDGGAYDLSVTFPGGTRVDKKNVKAGITEIRQTK